MPADDVQVAPDIIAEHAGQAQKCEQREIDEHGLAAEGVFIAHVAAEYFHRRVAA